MCENREISNRMNISMRKGSENGRDGVYLGNTLCSRFFFLEHKVDVTKKVRE